MNRFLVSTVFATAALHAQLEGLWQGYDGEWDGRRASPLL